MRVLALLAIPLTFAIHNGIGVTPPMGWRSWNAYQGDISEHIMRQIMDVMVHAQPWRAAGSDVVCCLQCALVPRR